MDSHKFERVPRIFYRVNSAIFVEVGFIPT